MQNWKKIGCLFQVTSNGDWSITHSAVPTVEPLGSGNFRVYYGTRNSAQQASIGFFEIDIRSPKRIKRVSEKPVLSPGELGTFDDSGVLPSWFLESGGRRYLYYIGWNLGTTVPFRNFTGLAVSDSPSEPFRRISRAPIADRDDADPFFYTNPCVLKEDGLWRIWYLSAVKWVIENGKPKHFYHIKYDESADGIHWNRKPTVAIDFVHEGEHAISRPCVIKEGQTYGMYYSYRSTPRAETYRIGFATSPDGKTWVRKDNEVGLDISGSGWDSRMIEYPYVFDHEGARYMLYNGDDFGRSGIGLAVLEQD
jgi:predicted GH43/DUF377 family glycosyl hydrolase